MLGREIYWTADLDLEIGGNHVICHTNRVSLTEIAAKKKGPVQLLIVDKRALVTYVKPAGGTPECLRF